MSTIRTKISGEQILDGSVTRTNLDVSIVSDIDTLKSHDTTQISQIAQLELDLGTEIDDRALADANVNLRVDGLVEDLSAEVTRAQGAESALSTRVGVLEQDPTTKTYVDQKVADLVNSAPAVLDTLNELATALGSDPNFATTVANNIGTVTANLAAEQSARVAADAALNSRVSSLESVKSVVREVPSGAVDGTNAQFTLAKTPQLGSEMVFLNGLLQEPAQAASSRPLDLFPASGAYSFRLLSSSYAGPVVKVRRSQDNATSDFSASQVNSGALESWVGVGSNGFVETFYDQSGNNRHFTQTNPSLQPQIVSNGVLFKSNGKPTLRFGGKYLEGGIPLGGAQTIFTVVNHLQPVTDSSAGYCVWGNYAGSYDVRFGFGIDTAQGIGRRRMLWSCNGLYQNNVGNYLLGYSDHSQNNTDILAGTYVYTNLYNGPTKIYQNQIDQPLSVATSPFGNANIVPNSISLLGTGANYNLSTEFEVSELIVYNTDQSANKEFIETNISLYYLSTEALPGSLLADYILSGKKITFLSSPEQGWRILVSYSTIE